MAKVKSCAIVTSVPQAFSSLLLEGQWGIEVAWLSVRLHWGGPCPADCWGSICLSYGVAGVAQFGSLCGE